MQQSRTRSTAFLKKAKRVSASTELKKNNVQILLLKTISALKLFFVVCCY